MRLVMAVLLVAVTQPATSPPLGQLLAGAGQYVTRFQDEFAIVVSDEQYDQRTVLTDESHRVRSWAQRRIRSETLFAWVAEEQSWLTARNVLTVDGAAVPDSKERLDAALGPPGPDRRGRLRRLRDEGARFNLGGIFRNFNDPTLVLQFLAPAFQERFEFTATGTEKIGGVETWKIGYVERGRPTLIQTTDGDMASTGLVWLDRAQVAVVRTKLLVRDPSTNTTGDVSVSYRFDRRLGINVPNRMTETYDQNVTQNVAPQGKPARLVRMRERIECVATYSNWRRFETSGRLVVP